MERAPVAKRRRLRMSSSSLRSCIVKGMSGCTSANLTGTSIDDLTNEVLIEIFLMLPAKTLHRFKTVSQRWLSIISSSCFARSYILTHVSDPSNNMILFKVEKVEVRSGQVYTLQYSSKDVSNFHFIPSLVPPLGPNYLNYDDYALDDIQADRSMRIGLSDKWPVDLYVKGTSGGLILLQGAFQNSIFDIYEPRRDNHYYYYVCNPVTKKWKELPLISTSDLVGFTCYHLQQRVGDGQEGECRIWLDGASYDNIIKRNTTFDPNKVEFTVVSIHVDEEDDVFKIKILSSTNEKAGWSTFCVPFPRGYEWVGIPCEYKKLLFYNGKFHWRGRDCIVAYDPFNRPEECDIIPLPPIDRSCRYDHLLGASERCLRLVLVREDESFLVWELVDYAKQVWVKKYEVNYTKNLNLIFMSFVGAGGADNDKVYMREVSTPSRIKILDLRSKSLQHIYTYPSSWENGYHMESVQTFLSSPWPTCDPLLQHK